MILAIWINVIDKKILQNFNLSKLKFRTKTAIFRVTQCRKSDISFGFHLINSVYPDFRRFIVTCLENISAGKELFLYIIVTCSVSEMLVIYSNRILLSSHKIWTSIKNLLSYYHIIQNLIQQLINKLKKNEQQSENFHKVTKLKFSANSYYKIDQFKIM